MISYGEILEQPFLILHHRDHGKSKEEGLTQGKPTTCLKVPRTSFTTLLSKKWRMLVLSIWEAGDRKESKALIRHSSGTQRALWPQTARTVSRSPANTGPHHLLSSLFHHLNLGLLHIADCRRYFPTALPSFPATHRCSPSPRSPQHLGRISHPWGPHHWNPAVSKFTLKIQLYKGNWYTEC